MDKITASAKIMSEVSPLDEFFVTLRANFLNKICLNKKKKCYRDCMKSGIFGTKRTVLNRKGSVACGVNLSVNVYIPVISCPSKKAMQGFTMRWYPATKKYKWTTQNCCMLLSIC